MMNEPISTIMTKDVVTVRPEDNMAVVKDILFKKHLHHLPVLKDKKLVGIITSFDLVKLGKPSDEYSGIKVEEVMTTRIATMGPNDKIGAAAQVFLENLFHGLPIVDENYNLVGIITTHDILKYQFHKEYPNHKLYWRTAG
ncbi:MAG: CBS domain-containing protein [Lewinellaceae bacterium]|nr:CBS domain-containing protein [Phaeodactylibacter sp.]MCB0613462.1 CBS domain-containing protein [Phaeodactylibacter sp.]MCB9348913.1 CBS domain-containing protein [Lewinellaceae bacterium]